MKNLYPRAVVEKRNVLNELRANNMTVQELRFFSIYLSKINPYDINTRRVRFLIEDFQKIMGFGKVIWLKDRYNEFLVAVNKAKLLGNPVKNRFRYFRQMIKNHYEDTP